MLEFSSNNVLECRIKVNILFLSGKTNKNTNFVLCRGGGRVLPCSGFINACILQGASQAQAPCCSNLKLVTSKKQSTEWYILYFPCTRDILSWKRALAKCASIALCTSFF